MAQHLSSRIRLALKLTWVALLLTLLGLVFGFTFWCRPIERNWYEHSLVLVNFLAVHGFVLG
jgi:hypothetical protein